MLKHSHEAFLMTDIRLSDRAARRVAEILKDEVAGASLRVSVEGGGCSGFQYKFEIDTRAAEEDLKLSGHGATVLIDSVSQPFLDGSEIDFVDDLMGQSFRIANPNATASCGCGTSFSI
jgi:iron-sulfur cluster assembly accessory protein